MRIQGIARLSTCVFIVRIYVHVHPALPALNSPPRRRSIPRAQAVVFLFTAYFIATIRKREDKRDILVPDVAQSQVMMNTLPNPEELKYKRTTYFDHEMMEASTAEFTYLQSSADSTVGRRHLILHQTS